MTKTSRPSPASNSHSSSQSFVVDQKGHPRPTFRQLLSNPAAFLAFGFGSGLSRIMPGTAGTLAAMPFFLLWQHLPIYTYIAMLVITAVIGVWLCAKASKWLGVHDHGGIVWDEFVGMWLTMLALPMTWPWLLAGFIAFRFFDMLKPWPISLADKHIHGGFGIMVDDVLAGLAACGCLHVARLIWFS